VPVEIVEALTNHKPSDSKMLERYNFARYTQRRKEIIQTLADQVEWGLV
jgi:hypothetical protein